MHVVALCVYHILLGVLWCLSARAELHLSEMLLRMELKGYENIFLINSVTKHLFNLDDANGRSC